MRFRLSPIAFSVLCVFAPFRSSADEPLNLKLDRTFNVMPEPTEPTPAFISAERIVGKKDRQIEAIGHAELRKYGETISADSLLYRQDDSELIANGSVHVRQKSDEMTGPHLELNLDSGIGDMSQPVFRLGGDYARGDADSLHLAGKKKFTLHNVNYTTCPAGDDDWVLNMTRLDIDRSTNLGVAHGALVEFKGMPVLYTPWMDFALNDQRKSGFLGPVFGSTTKGGSEITVPFYWNIAPNYDATIAPRFMTRRGLLLGTEFRYLQPDYAGKLQVDVLPNDQITGRTRSRLSVKHAQNLGAGFSGSVNFNRVSDNAYLRDMSTSVNGSSQINLLRQGTLSYNGGWWNAAATLQRYQTLQDPAAPVAIPYRRLPQLTLSARHALDKAKVSLSSEYTDFRHPTAVNGQRLVFYPSVSYPLLADPGYYVTPKLGLHNTYYHLGKNNTAGLPATDSRTLPIFSMDSGMSLERNWSFAGHDLVQTLEPRAYYVYIPYQNQSMLPVFDSAQTPFSFAQIFTENRFVGNDRVGDANQLTLALTSRYLDPKNGLEHLRLMVGERFSLTTPRVNLVAPTTTTNKSDILVGASGLLTRAVSLDTLWQYNPTVSRTETFNTALHYKPEIGKVVNLGYRFTRNSVRQVDLSTQWPLRGRWDTVARWNYSLQEKRLLEGLVGVEYNQSCWTVRLVAQRFTTATFQASTGFFVQLELNDLVRVGSDPLDALRRSVPGYTKTNQGPDVQPLQGLR